MGGHRTDHRRRLRLRKIITQVIAFLLLVSGGAVVNVAVAWGCALRSETDDGAIIEVDQWPRRVPDDWPHRPDGGWLFCGPGLSVMMSDGHGPEPEGRWVGDSFAGAWGLDLYRHVWFSSGAPFRSMHWCLYDMMPEGRGTLDHWPDRPHGHLESGLAPPRAPLGRGGWVFQRRLPLALLWPGFLINTLFYAVLLWLPFAAPGVVRRQIRKRRGHCIQCGYDLRGTPRSGCPECGWNRETEAAG